MTAVSTSPSRPETPALRQPRGLSEVMLQVLIMTAVLVVLLVVLRISNPKAFRPDNLQPLSREIAILSLIALGQAVVLISGGIDLSVGSVVCFVGLNTLWLLAPPAYAQHAAWPAWFILPGALAFATALGITHGVLVCLVRLPPFMVTLCSLLILRSLARGITGDQSVSYRDSLMPGFSFLGNGLLPLGTIHTTKADGSLLEVPVGIPIAVLVLLGVLTALAFFMHWTVHGRYLYAIGYNLEAARFSGVRVHRLRIVAYAICGFLAGLAGLIQASNVHNVAPSSAGLAYELHAITAAVLGGCALRGGQGSLVGVVVGVAILTVLQPMIVFIGLGTYYTDAVIGLVLLAAVVADSLVKRRRGQ